MKIKIFIISFLISTLFLSNIAFAFDTSNIDVSSFIDPITGVYGYQLPSLPDTILGDTKYQYYTIVFNTKIQRCFLYGHDVPFTVRYESDSFLRTATLGHYYVQYYVDFTAGADSSKWTLLSQKYDTTYWYLFENQNSMVYPVHCNYDLISWHDSTTVIFEKCELGQKRLTDGFHTDDDLVPTPSPDEPTSPPESSEDGGLIDAIINLPGRIVDAIKFLFDLVIDTILGFVDRLKELLIFLFVPDTFLIDDIVNTVKSKFVVFEQVHDLYISLFSHEIVSTPPNFTFELYGSRYSTVDFTFLDPYIHHIRQFLAFFAIFGFIRWMLVNIPNIIMGNGLNETDNDLKV